MAEEDEGTVGRSFFDLSQYSDRTRKIIFAVLIILLLGVIVIAMFVISPKNDERLAKNSEPAPTATQAKVDEVTGGEALTSSDDAELQKNEELPVDEMDEARKAQQKVIEDSLQREKEQTDALVEDTHRPVENAAALKDIASQGMLQYCTDNPGETKEDKQARMKPFFHADNSDYQSPQSIFYLTRCSVEGLTEPTYENDQIIVYVGMAWGAQLEEEGSAETGYAQYRVVVDKDGIVSFDD